jgi:hypothetical protein
MRRLAQPPTHLHHKVVDDPEATQLILQTLFDIKADVRDIHDVIFGGGDYEDQPEDDS